MTSLRILYAALALTLASCSDEAEVVESVEPEEVVAETSDDLAQRLVELGYAEYAEEVDDREGGVVLRDATRSQPGYDLVAVVPAKRATLVDAEGAVVNEWTIDDAASVSRALLLASGDVVMLAMRRVDDAPQLFMERQTWDGDVVWRVDRKVHHDIRETPGGHLLAIESRDRDAPELLAGRPVRDNVLVRFDHDGRAVDEVSLLDALRRGPGAIAIEQLYDDTGGSLDLLHTNSVQWIPSEYVGATPLHVDDAVIVSIRHQSVIAIIDWSEGACLWSWGRPETLRQHEALFVPDGRVVLFDNGWWTRKWSRLLEVDPVERAITWEWRAPTPSDFYSQGRGTVQRLANGNLLASNSNSGEVFEVARDGDVVWRYLTPHVDKKGRRSALRAARYPVEFVDEILARRGR